MTFDILAAPIKPKHTFSIGPTKNLADLFVRPAACFRVQPSPAEQQRSIANERTLLYAAEAVDHQCLLSYQRVVDSVCWVGRKEGQPDTWVYE